MIIGHSQNKGVILSRIFKKGISFFRHIYPIVTREELSGNSYITQIISDDSTITQSISANSTITETVTGNSHII